MPITITICNTDIPAWKFDKIMRILSTPDKEGRRVSDITSRLMASEIMQLVEKYHSDFPEFATKGKSKHWKNIYRYFIYIYCSETLSSSTKQFPVILGKAHGHIISGWRTISDWYKTDIEIKRLIDQIDWHINEHIKQSNTINNETR